MNDYVSKNAITKVLNTMDRYVADELTLCDTEKKFPRNEVFIVDDVYEEIVEQLPPADVRENIHGEWIKYSFPRCGEQHYQCTSCGYYINFGQWGDLYTKEFKFCPNCGARMKGSE